MRVQDSNTTRRIKQKSVEAQFFAVSSSTAFDNYGMINSEKEEIPLFEFEGKTEPERITGKPQRQSYGHSYHFLPVEVPTNPISNTQDIYEEIVLGIKIRKLVESGDIAKARSLLSKIGSDRTTNHSLEIWEALLALPKAVRSDEATGKPFGKCAAVLKANIDEYAGQWVAILDDVLLGGNESKIALYRSLKDQDKLKGAIFFYIEK